ncbi:MAG TPA: hypothetical protein VGR84_18885 [Candidatus Acidoferrales bacterium]|nr:hypothetical protein [Candidatus Acidoferrales bacterium]
MPKKRFSAKEDRQASHIAASERARGMSAREARSVGYATVNKIRGKRRSKRSARK